MLDAQLKAGCGGIGWDRVSLTDTDVHCHFFQRLISDSFIRERKSQLIVEYSYRIRDKEPDRFVLWVHASNVVRFEQSYQQIADRVNIGGDQESSSDLMKSVLKWLQDPRHKWKLILDSVDDDSFFDECRYSNGPESAMLPVRAFIPMSTNGSMIMTTRSKAVADGFVNDKFHIDVGPMSEADAQLLLGAKLGGRLTTEDKELVPRLVEALDFIPLALVHAAAYIKKKIALSVGTEIHRRVWKE